MCAPVAFAQSGFLTLLKRRSFEADNSAAQLEMNIALGQTPPSVQPPPLNPLSKSGSAGRPILHGVTVGRSDMMQLPSKMVPRFLPLLSLPRGIKKKELRVHFFKLKITTKDEHFWKSCGIYHSGAADLSVRLKKMDYFSQKTQNPRDSYSAKCVFY